MINEDIRHIVESELLEGEELLWAEKPQTPPSGEKGVLYLIVTTLIGLFLFSFSFIPFESGNIVFDKFWPIIIWVSVPLCLIGSVKEYRQFQKARQSTHYALTTKRLLIISQQPSPQICEYTKENLYWLKPKMKKHDSLRMSGFGDIEIVPKPEGRWGEPSHFEDLLNQNKKIQNIPNVYRVMELIFQNILSKESPYEQAR